MAQHVFWSQSFVDEPGTPATNFYIQAIDNSNTSVTLAIYSDADGNSRLDDDIAEADQYGVISFYGTGTYDLRLYERAGTTPAPLTDNLLNTFEKVRLIDPEPVYDEDNLATLNSLPYIQGQSLQAGFGVKTISDGIPMVEDYVAVYEIDGGTTGDVIDTISVSGSFSNRPGRLIILCFRKYYQYRNGGNMLLNGDFSTYDGAVLTLVLQSGSWREVSRSHNVDVTDDAATYDSPVNVTASKYIIVKDPASVVFVDPNGQTELRQMYWMAVNDDPPPGTVVTLCFTDSIVVADGYGFILASDYNAAVDFTLTVVAVSYAGGDIKWMEISRSHNGYSLSGQWLNTIDNPVVDNEVDTYYIAGSGDPSEANPIQSLIGGYEGMKLRLICRMPTNAMPTQVATDYPEEMLQIRRVLIAGDASVAGVGTIVLKGNDNFFMLPEETLDLVRVDYPGGNGATYWWNEVARTERTDLFPEIEVTASKNISTWRHQHIIELDSPTMTYAINTLGNHQDGYEVMLIKKTTTSGKIQFLHSGEVFFTAPPDLRLQDENDTMIFVKRGERWINTASVLPGL